MQQQLQVQNQQLAKSSKKKKDDWIWWAVGGTVVGVAAVGIGWILFGNKLNEPTPISPDIPWAPDIANISQDPFMNINYSGAGGKIYNTPQNEFQRVTSSQATKKPCGCSAKKH